MAVQVAVVRGLLAQTVRLMLVQLAVLVSLLQSQAHL
jgi:hypothetical protein